MRNRFITFSSAACCALLILLTGCSRSLPGPGIGKLTDDEVLIAEVTDRLSNDEVVRGHNIGVRAHNGVITLIGLPADPGRRARALSIAEGTPGVNAVSNAAAP
jgi:osmotically-inducible protein OsmY